MELRHPAWKRLEDVELLVPVLLAAAIFCAALGSSSLHWTLSAGLRLRWVALGLLAIASVPYGLRDWARIPRAFWFSVCTFAALAVLSATWSVKPKYSAEHAATFVVLVVAVALVAAGSGGSRARRDRLVMAVLGASVLFALVGLVLVIADYGAAVQVATAGTPTRLRGLGQDPNTAALLFSIVGPAAVGWTVEAHAFRAKVVGGGVVLLLFGSILASGSRGAMIAVFVGTGAYVAVRVRPLRSLLLAETVVVVAALLMFVIGGSRPPSRPPGGPLQRPTQTIGTTAPTGRTSPPSTALPATAPPATTTLPAATPAAATPPLSTPSSTTSRSATPASTSVSATPARASSTDNGSTTSVATTSPKATIPAATGRSGAKGPSTVAAARQSVAWWQIRLGPTMPPALVPVPFVRTEDELGYPGLYQYKPLLQYGSGRVYAWISAISQGLQRPFLGYGFATEPIVFQDRSFYFQGAYTESSLVGMFLQLGVIGLLLIVLPFVLCAVMVGRAVSRASRVDRQALAVLSGMVAAAFLAGLFQSYLYSVGSIATLTAWASVAILMCVASPLARRARA